MYVRKAKTLFSLLVLDSHLVILVQVIWNYFKSRDATAYSVLSPETNRWEVMGGCDTPHSGKSNF